jgi:hypothetical protein
MRLWTWQVVGCEPTVARIDPRHKDSFFTMLPEYQRTYERLWKEAGTDQILWCFADEVAAKDPWTIPPRMLWRLEIAEELILATIDWGVWERILNGYKAPIPHCTRLHERWWSEAIKQGLPSVEYRERKYEEFRKLPPPRGDWWLELFLESPHERGWTARWLEETIGDCSFVPQILLKRPIPAYRVL